MANDVLVDSKWMYSIELGFMDIMNKLTQLIVFLYIIGFFQVKPDIFVAISFMVKNIYAVFLIYRFNKYRDLVKLTELDRRVIFSCAMTIIMFSFIDVANTYMAAIQKFVSSYTAPYVEQVQQMLPQFLKQNTNNSILSN